MKQLSVTEDFLKQALQAHTAMRDWIKAVPDDIQLPAMPGVDGDWLDDVQGTLTSALEQPAQEPYRYAWHQYMDHGNGMGWIECVTDYDPRTPDYAEMYHRVDWADTKQVRNFRALYTAPLQAPAQEPESPNIQAQWLGNALFDCIRASGIIRNDIGSLSVAELLFFSKDLKGMLERQAAAQASPAQEPDAASTITQIANNYGRRVGNLWHFDDLALSIFTAKIRGLNAPTPSPVQEPTDAQIALLDPWMRPAAAKELLTQVLALKTASKTS